MPREMVRAKAIAAKRLEVYEEDRQSYHRRHCSRICRCMPQGKAAGVHLNNIVNGPLALVPRISFIFTRFYNFYKCADNRQCRKGSPDCVVFSRNVARACRAWLEES